MKRYTRILTAASLACLSYVHAQDGEVPEISEPMDSLTATIQEEAPPSCPALDSLKAATKPSDALRLAALECAPRSFADMKNPSTKVLAKALDLDCGNIAFAKNVDKKQLAKAVQLAKDSARCVAPLHAHLGEKNKSWISLRKELLALQPQALFDLYGWKPLSESERKALFLSNKPLSAEACAQLWDSAGTTSLLPKDWNSRSFAFDSLASSCKLSLQSKLLPLFDSLVAEGDRRARLLGWYPQVWQERFGDSSDETEKARYVTSASLRDSSHCRYTDWTTPDLLMRFGVQDNACAGYIRERFGDALFIMEFRRDFKPADLAKLLTRMDKMSPADLVKNQAFLDTLGRLLGSVESWEVTDSVEAHSLKMFVRIPGAVQYFREPTAPMILSAAEGDARILCRYPVTDRMLSKMLMDRLEDEKPLPGPEERSALQECLAPELWGALEKMLAQLDAQNAAP